MSAPSDDASTRVGNRYRLDERIGAGAMGAVWRGTDELLNRTVAIKELLAAAEPHTAAGVDALEESRQRLMREGRIGARLQHPHVISMFDVVVHEDRPWLIMEYLPSKSLAALLTEHGVMEPREVADIGRQVADGLAAAHAAGVVHRDVKPGNVLIADDGRVKLTDFGVSRAVDDVQLTRTGLIAGTPAFLAPEVARGSEPAAASDVFALGATLYAAVEGRPPFGLDDNAYALLHKVATGKVDPPEQAGPLTALLMRLLDDDPQARPSVEEARDALAAIAAGRPAAVPAATLVASAPAAAAGQTSVPRAAAAPPAESTRADLPAAPPPPPPPSGSDGTGDGDGPRRRTPLLLALLAALVAAGGITAAVLAGQGDDPETTPGAASVTSTAPARTTTAAPTTTTAPTTTSASPTTTAETTTATEAPATDAVAFVQSYYALLPENTGAAFAMLGPEAQGQSNGRGGFESFYGRMSAVDIVDVRATGDNTVAGTVVFTQQDGSVSREPYRFVVGTGDDGRPVITSFRQG